MSIRWPWLKIRKSPASEETRSTPSCNSETSETFLHWVTAIYQYVRVRHIGDLWVDWTNELRGGKRRVWRVVALGENHRALEMQLGKEERIGPCVVSKTNIFQIFPEATFEITPLLPEEAGRGDMEPSSPYNILGVKTLTKHKDKPASSCGVKA